MENLPQLSVLFFISASLAAISFGGLVGAWCIVLSLEFGNDDDDVTVMGLVVSIVGVLLAAVAATHIYIEPDEASVRPAYIVGMIGAGLVLSMVIWRTTQVAEQAVYHQRWVYVVVAVGAFASAMMLQAYGAI